MIARIFWSLFTIEAGLCVVLALSFFRPQTTRGWGPEGPVGGWLVLIPPVFFAALAAVVLIVRSDKVKIYGIVCMALPLVQLAVGPLYQKLQDLQTDSRARGDATFFWPSQRGLAHAIVEHDVRRVRELIPRAGDPNTLHHGQSFLNFAIGKAEKAPGSVEIVQALIDAGANPNGVAYPNLLPLTVAISDSPRMTETLLRAGADPNRRDSAGRPIWWDAVTYDTGERLETLRLLLDHGADLSLRDSEGGPVAWASRHASMSHGGDWRLVWMLIERGAPWKDDQEFGQTAVSMFLDDFRSREQYHPDRMTEAMRRIKARIDAELPAQ